MYYLKKPTARYYCKTKFFRTGKYYSENLFVNLISYTYKKSPRFIWSDYKHMNLQFVQKAYLNGTPFVYCHN